MSLQKPSAAGFLSGKQKNTSVSSKSKKLIINKVSVEDQASVEEKDLNLSMPVTLIQSFRIFCVTRNITMKNAAREAITEYMKRNQ